jgi:hypothetical protein
VNKREMAKLAVKKNIKIYKTSLPNPGKYLPKSLHNLDTSVSRPLSFHTRGPGGSMS